MLQSLFVLSSAGEVLIQKHCRGVTSRTACDLFWDEVMKQEMRQDTPPVITTPRHILVSILRDGLFLLATIGSETSPLMVIEFLHRIADIFQDYFGHVDETSVKENFTTVYQLLEEMLDNGYPLITEPNALKAMIAPPSMMGRLAASVSGKSGVSDVLPDGTISNMPWRAANVRYAQNEIYVDIVEEIDAIVDCNGQMVSCDVSGTLHCNSRLSGVPDLCLTFTNPSVIDDCSFHPCVRINRWEREQLVSFVPPDGQFDLMQYRVNVQAQQVSPPIYCTPQITYHEEHGSAGGRLAVMVGSKPMSSLAVSARRGGGAGAGNNVTVEDVVVTIPFPRAVRTADLNANVGSVLYDEANKVAKWTIGRLTRDKSPKLQGSLVLQQGALPEESPPLLLAWKVPMATVSGLCVDSLQLINSSVRPYRGTRSATKSGRYQIRTV